MSYALQFERDMRAQRLEVSQRETSQRMKVEGSHILCGVDYWPSYRGSKVLAPIIARVKAREAV